MPSKLAEHAVSSTARLAMQFQIGVFMRASQPLCGLVSLRSVVRF